MNIFQLTNEQKWIVSEIHKLKLAKLYYIVLTQTECENELTLAEFKMLINKSLKRTLEHERKNNPFKTGDIRYVTVFEMGGYLSKSQKTSKIHTSEIKSLGLHAHIFIENTTLIQNESLGLDFGYVFGKYEPKPHRIDSYYTCSRNLIYDMNRFLEYHVKQFTLTGGLSEMVMTKN